MVSNSRSGGGHLHFHGTESMNLPIDSPLQCYIYMQVSFYFLGQVQCWDVNTSADLATVEFANYRVTDLCGNESGLVYYALISHSSSSVTLIKCVRAADATVLDTITVRQSEETWTVPKVF